MLSVALVSSIISLLVVCIAMAILGFSIERGEKQSDTDNNTNDNTDTSDASDASDAVPTTTFDDTTTPTDNMPQNTDAYPVSHASNSSVSFNTDTYDATDAHTNNDTDNMPTIS